jgi:hypothetical protein
MMAMPRIPQSRLVFVLVTALALVVVPMAGARSLETPQAAHRTLDGWFSAALRWAEELAGLRAVTPDHGGRSATAPHQQGTKAAAGGSCIDPQGNTRPWCL